MRRKSTRLSTERGCKLQTPGARDVQLAMKQRGQGKFKHGPTVIFAPKGGPTSGDPFDHNDYFDCSSPCSEHLYGLSETLNKRTRTKRHTL